VTLRSGGSGNRFWYTNYTAHLSPESPRTARQTHRVLDSDTPLNSKYTYPARVNFYPMLPLKHHTPGMH